MSDRTTSPARNTAGDSSSLGAWVSRPSMELALDPLIGLHVRRVILVT